MRVPQSWARARLTLFLTIATALVFVLLSATRLSEMAAIWGGFIPARLAFGDQGDVLAPFWLTPLTAAFSTPTGSTSASTS